MVGLMDRLNPMSDGGGSKRCWRIALMASLAVNLLFVGVVGVWAVRPMFRGPPQAPEFGRVIERMTHRLNDSDAAILKRAYDERRDEMTRLTGSVRDARQKVRRALQADPFDPVALKSAMDEVRAARSAVEEAIQDVMRSGAASMSADGRRTLARGPRNGP